MNAVARRFLIDTVIYGASRVVLSLRSIILIAVFFRLMRSGGAAEEYGIYTQVHLLAYLIAPVISLRLGASVVRFLSGESEPSVFRRIFYTAFACVLVLAGLGSVLVALGGEWVEHALLGTAKGGSIAGCAAVVLGATTVLTFLQEHYRIIDRIQLLSFLDLIEAVIEIIVVSVIVAMGYGAPGALVGSAATRGLWAVGLFGDVVRRHGSVRGSFDRQSLRALLGFSIPLIPNGISRWFFGYADRLVIAFVFGPDVAPSLLGVYNATYQFGAILNLLMNPLGFVFYPLVARLWDGGHVEEVRRYFARVLRYYLIVTIPAAIGCALVAPSVLALLSDDGLVADHWLVLSISAGVVAYGFFQICAFSFHLSKETRYVSAILVPCAVLAVILNLVLVSMLASVGGPEEGARLGLLGAGVSSLIVSLVMAFIGYRAGRSRVGYRVPWMDAAKALAVALVLHLALVWVIAPSWAMVALTIAISVVVYVAAMIITGVLSRAEIRQLASLWQG